MRQAEEERESESVHGREREREDMWEKNDKRAFHMKVIISVWFHSSI